MGREQVTPPHPISVGADVGHFDCGHEALDEWLRRRALDSEGRSARTYVVTAGNVAVAYCCLSTGAVSRAEVPRKIRHGLPDPVPAMIVGRLAVDTRYQGRGLGRALLADALKRSLAASKIAGCRTPLVHAIDDKAAAFYAAYGFIAFPGGSRTLFLPIGSVAVAI